MNTEFFSSIVDQRLLSVSTIYLARVLTHESGADKCTLQPLSLTKAVGGTAKKQAILPDVPISQSVLGALGTGRTLEGVVAIVASCERDISQTRKNTYALPAKRHHSKSDSVVIGCLTENKNTGEGSSHSHENLYVLDGITEADVTKWNEAFEKSHVHENKDVIDGITLDTFGVESVAELPEIDIVPRLDTLEFHHPLKFDMKHYTNKEAGGLPGGGYRLLPGIVLDQSWKTSAGELPSELYKSIAYNSAISLGVGCAAEAENSIAVGLRTIAKGTNQLAIGTVNKADDKNEFVFIIGNGKLVWSGDQITRKESNALTVTWDGVLWTPNDITTGDGISLVAIAAEVAAAQTAIEANAAAIDSTNAAVQSTLGTSKKNLMKVTAASQTKNGLTFTVGDDGSVTVSGTATAETYIAVRSMSLTANTGYILSGCPAQQTESWMYRIYAMNTTSWAIAGGDYGKGFTFNTGNYTGWTFRIHFKSGATVDNLVFRPMLRLAAITDNTFEPYTDDLQTQINTLLARIEGLEAQLAST